MAHKMSFSSDDEIRHIAQGLIDRTLPRNEWTHAAHFAAAAWLLSDKQHNAFLEMPGFIRDYNEATGTANTDSEGYHETITIASLRATRHMLASKAVEQPLYATVNSILQSELGNPKWLFQFWTKDRLFSVAARKTWIEPDLAPLPYE